MKLQIKIRNEGPHALPAYETSGAAGMDLKAWLNEPLVLKPMERQLVRTGLYIDLPAGYEAQVRPRSGMAIKKGITLINSPGTIDSDYRGEIKLPIINLSQEVQTIEDGDRIAQMVIARHETVEWQECATLSGTERGDGGFGSSGIK